MAGILAVAQLVAVARRRDGPGDLCGRRHVRAGLAARWPRRCAARPGARPADGAGRGRDPVVHRHDLRLAHHHSGVEPSPGRPALRAARTDHRPGGAQCDRGDRTGWHLDARRLAHAAAADGRVDRQDHLLERHRRSAPHAHRRRGDGARPVRTGATARPATHASQFRDARDGLSGGAQACRAAAADRGAAVVRGAGRA